MNTEGDVEGFTRACEDAAKTFGIREFHLLVRNGQEGVIDEHGRWSPVIMGHWEQTEDGIAGGQGRSAESVRWDGIVTLILMAAAVAVALLLFWLAGRDPRGGT